jgi:pimeloyl-ACP methyl ester carboxylesterase
MGEGMTDYVRTEDGTRIAYDRRGDGPAVVLIGGAGQFRAVDPATRELTEMLGTRGFTVVHYDRPGRGDSAGEPPFTLAGEVAAVRALVAGLGGTATLYGSSSGAAIALAAAAEIPGVERLLLWEAPLGADGGTDGAEFLAGVRETVAGGDPERILGFFMQGMPPEWFEGMRRGEQWPLFARMAPTVVADAEALAWTQSRPRRELWRGITVPTVVLLGRSAFPFFHDAADSIVASLPNARRATVDGAGHEWSPAAMADALAAHLRDG